MQNPYWKLEFCCLWNVRLNLNIEQCVYTSFCKWQNPASPAVKAHKASSAPLAPNMGILALQPRLTSWLTMMKITIAQKVVSQVCISKTCSLTRGWLRFFWTMRFNPTTTTVALGSSFQDIQTGQLTLRGLCHQKMYIMKFIARYASVMILRWVTGKCSMASAMHCITIYEVWIKT